MEQYLINNKTNQILIENLDYLILEACFKHINIIRSNAILLCLNNWKCVVVMT